MEQGRIRDDRIAVANETRRMDERPMIRGMIAENSIRVEYTRLLSSHAGCAHTDAPSVSSAMRTTATLRCMSNDAPPLVADHSTAAAM